MSQRKVRVIQTQQHSDDRLTEKASLSFRPDEHGTEMPLINIYDDLTYQEMIGFGGAITEASAVTAAKLGESNRNEIIKSYYDAQDGIGYTTCRTHINSCDFSSATTLT